MSVEEAASQAAVLLNTLRWSRAGEEARKAKGAQLAEARKAARQRRAGKRRIKKTQPSTTE